MKTIRRFLTILLSIKVVVLLIVPLAGQLVNAQTAVPCSKLAAVSSLAPEWVAVRQQYERSYRPATTHNPQTAIAQVAALPMPNACAGMSGGVPAVRTQLSAHRYRLHSTLDNLLAARC
jgi:hypothetical protein